MKFKLMWLGILCITHTYAQNIPKEIFIIGTMHTVPKIVKNSYQPLLKIAIKYQPDAIYVESPMPNDEKSWEYLRNGWSVAYKNFYYLSDSLKKTFKVDQIKIKKLLTKRLSQLQDEELDELINSFANERDYANYSYYKYIKNYGSTGTKELFRNENQDLTYKLALKLGIAKLNNMDDQQTNQEYHQAWTDCMKIGANNGNNLINKKLNKKDYNQSIIPALLGRLGKHTSRIKSLKRMHILNSFSYGQHDAESCSQATKYWNERNDRMAQNILQQIKESPSVRNLVVVGAGHVWGLREALQKQNPSIKLKLIYE